MKGLRRFPAAGSRRTRWADTRRADWHTRIRAAWWRAALCAVALVSVPAVALAQANCAGVSTGNIPLNDLGTGLYLGQFQGGLYQGGRNAPPRAHFLEGQARGAAVQPLDVTGAPSATGRYVFLSIGMSGPSHEFCRNPGGTTSCSSSSFMTQAAADPAVNQTTLAIINGAYNGRGGRYWDDPSDTDYDRIRDDLLLPSGLSELQVQAVWLKVIWNAFPRSSLPAADADAYNTVANLGNIVRALKVRYPNLQQVFVSSRIYAGYAKLDRPLYPEPYSYEHGFGVKWLIQAQITQIFKGTVDSRAGNLDYRTGVAPWIAWGPYLWADGVNPRSDGLTWQCADFNATDGTHPSPSGIDKVADRLLNFFKTNGTTSMWFLAD